MKYLLIMLCLASAPIFAQNSGDIEGFWYMPSDKDGNTAVAKIFAQGGKYHAFSFSYTNGGALQKVDSANPDPALRKRPLRGLIFLRNLEFSGGAWHNGSIYRPDDGKSFYAKVKISADKNTLTIRASIDRTGILGGTLIWHRADASHEKELKDLAPFF